MEKLLSSKITAIALMVLALAAVGIFVFSISQPLFYGAEYRTKGEFAGQTFEGVMKFYPDGTMVSVNSNIGVEMKSLYYYRDGYVFFATAITEEAYRAEIEYINENFAQAVREPFYAARADIFSVVSEGPSGDSSVYTCPTAHVVTWSSASATLVFSLLSLLSFVLLRKARDEG